MKQNVFKIISKLWDFPLNLKIPGGNITVIFFSMEGHYFIIAVAL
jgi:hypothetical protein